MSETTTISQPNLAEQGPIRTLFSGPARTQIIEAFVANKSRELNVSDIARLSDTARSSVYRHLEELEELDIIEAVDAGGRTRYTLNEDSEIATRLWELEGLTLKKLLENDEKTD
jgi:DNA-binding transcriptional ArsR family regulator